MSSSTKCLALCLALLVTAGAGIAEAKADDVKASSSKKGEAPGQVKKDASLPSLPGAQEPVPTPSPGAQPAPPSVVGGSAPQPAPEPTPEPAPAPAPEPGPSAPAVGETPAPASSSAPSLASSPAPASSPAASSASAAPEAAPAAEAVEPAAAERVAPEAASDASDDAAPAQFVARPDLSLPFVAPRLGGAVASSAPLGMAAAAPAAPSGLAFDLRWGVPLAGLLLLGIVLSSARLVQPRSLPGARAPPAPVAPAPAAAAASAAVAPAPQVPVALVPRDLDSLLRAAKAAAEAERLEEAVQWLDRALRLAPALPVAHFCRGVCLAGLGRDAEAHAALRRAHELDPTEGAYRLELARACGRLGRTGEAMDVLGLLLQAVPELVDDVATDPCFEGLRDHPRFLAMTGRL